MHSYFAEVKVVYNKQKYGAFNVHCHSAIQESLATANSSNGNFTVMFIIDEIEVRYFEKAYMLQIEWTTSPKNDLVADTLSLLIL